MATRSRASSLAPVSRPRAHLHRLGPRTLCAPLRVRRLPPPLPRPARGAGGKSPARAPRRLPDPHAAAAHILDSFPIVQRKDEQTHGESRTKRVILETYDALNEAASSSDPYRTPLDPSPAARRAGAEVAAHKETP